jgi:hypothetical protein
MRSTCVGTLSLTVVVVAYYTDSTFDMYVLEVRTSEPVLLVGVDQTSVIGTGRVGRYLMRNVMGKASAADGAETGNGRMVV